MGRLTQAISLINLHPDELSTGWRQSHLTKISITEGVLNLRKEKLKEKRLKEKANQRARMNEEAKSFS